MPVAPTRRRTPKGIHPPSGHPSRQPRPQRRGRSLNMPTIKFTWTIRKPIMMFNHI